MFEIWHTTTNNIIDYFDSAETAEAAILDAIRAQGKDVLDKAYMIRVDEAGDSYFLAEGQAIPAALRRLRNEEASLSVPFDPGRRIAE